jgi:hypothetical protein
MSEEYKKYKKYKESVLTQVLLTPGFWFLVPLFGLLVLLVLLELLVLLPKVAPA